MSIDMRNMRYEIERLTAELLSRDAIWLPEKDAEIERLTGQVESLQNKWASRELSQQDSDALMAENERLRAVLEYWQTFLPVMREFLWLALCWNDHNFEEGTVTGKCNELCKQLGINSVEEANEILEAFAAVEDANQG